MSHFNLDAKNMLCPLPVIRTQDLVETLAHGDTVTVTCTDPGALNDIPAWCRINGHQLDATAETNGYVTITLTVNKQNAQK